MFYNSWSEWRRSVLQRFLVTMAILPAVAVLIVVVEGLSG